MVSNRGERLVKAVAGAAPVSSAPAPVTTRTGAGEPAPQEAAQEPLGMVSLADVRAMLGEQQAHHNAAMGALQASHREAMAMMVERVDAAEIRAERVEQRLDQVLDVLLTERRQPMASVDEPAEHEPWWRRWFGHSTRSKLGGE
jgi:hypothetical protein